MIVPNRLDVEGTKSYGDVSDREIRDSPPPSTAVPGPVKGVATQ